MIKLELLKPFVFYRTPGKLLAPESPTNRKKGVIYSVLSPSLDEEFQFISNSTYTDIQFRNLYRLFIEKFTLYKLQGHGQLKINNVEDGLLDAAYQSVAKNVNLKNVDGVTSHQPNIKADPIKGFNTLFEVNQLTDRIINNEKDHRILSMKAADIINVWKTQLDDKNLAQYGFTSNKFSEHVVFIPINSWVTVEEMKSPTTLISKTTKNVMGAILYQLQTNPKLTKEIFGSKIVLLVSGNNVMRVDLNDLPKDAKPTIFTDSFKHFLAKNHGGDNDGLQPALDTTGKGVSKRVVSKESERRAADVADTETEVDALRDVQVQSAKVQAVEDVLEKSNIDPDSIDASKKAKLVDMVSEVELKVPIYDPTKPSSAEPGETSIFIKTEPKLDVNIPKLQDTSDVDLVIQARLAGQTIENYKRNQMLREKYKTLTVDGKKVSELQGLSETSYKVPDVEVKANVINPALKSIKAYTFEKSYNDNLMTYDFANILTHFANAKPALYLINDPIREDVSDTMNKLYKYTVEYEDENRKRSKFSFLMPKWYQDKYLFINEQKWNIIHQKLPFPVTKVDPNKCQVATNYNKIFMSRYGANTSPKITKLKKILSGADCPSLVKMDRGDCTTLNREFLTTIEFDELSNTFYKLRIKNLIMFFNIADANLLVGAIPKGVPGDNVFPIAIDSTAKMKFYMSGETNKVYNQNGDDLGELSDFIINQITVSVPKFIDQFADTSAGTKFVYTRAKVMAEDIPLVLVLAAADPGGLTTVLEKAKINFQFTEQRPSIDKDNFGVIQFADGYLVYPRYPYENSLLMNGLNTFPTKEFSYSDMNSRDTYVELFDLMFNRRNLIDGIENFYYLLIDPITHDVLRRLGMPETFTELLLYASGLLADNTYRIDSDYTQSRLRSNEIVNAYLYQELCTAYASYKIGRSPKFAIPEDAVLKDLLESNIVDSHSKLNVTLEAENDRQVKLKGPGGMNEDRSFTLEKRAYHESMRGIIGMNSTPSGEVGINRHMSLNCNIQDARGFLAVGKDDYDGTELGTPGELLNVFGIESADTERVAMTISQSKHTVPVAKSCAGLVSYDMERVIPYISSDFTFVSKGDGKVVTIENDIMVVQYADGKYDDIDLSENPDKNTDGGFYIMNSMVTNLKVGDKFKKGEVLAYNKKYINSPDAYGDCTANVGTLGRVALVTNGNVYEDACYITDALARDMATKITLEKNVIISKYANIKYMAKKGQVIKANEPILIFDDTEDQFTSQLLLSMAEETEDEENIVATGAPVISKVAGVIKDIKIYYTVPPSEMTASLRKIVDVYSKDVVKREKTLAKFINPKDANTILTPSTQVTPDSSNRVKGIKIEEGIIIEFYIEYDDIMGVGDKLS